MSLGFHRLPWEWRLLSCLWDLFTVIHIWVVSSAAALPSCQESHTWHFIPLPKNRCTVIWNTFRCPREPTGQADMTQSWQDDCLELSFLEQQLGMGWIPNSMSKAWDSDVEEWKSDTHNDSYNLAKMVWLTSPIHLAFTLCVNWLLSLLFIAGLTNNPVPASTASSCLSFRNHRGKLSYL